MVMTQGINDMARQFKYDPGRVVVQDFTPGDKAQAAIVNIATGTLQQLYGVDTLKNMDNAESEGIEIMVEGEHEGVPFKASKIFPIKQYVKNRIVVGPKSDLAKFRQKYGAFPRPGLIVDCVVNNSGYWNVVIE